MKLTTAIELLRHNSTQRQLQEMKDLKSLIMLASGGIMTESDFTMGWITETDMSINIDEISFEIDGVDFVTWLNNNCNTEHESDKSITVTSLGSN